nr:hypothetical protein Iba_chr10aCG6210 [Ipomoea batatas]
MGTPDWSTQSGACPDTQDLQLIQETGGISEPDAYTSASVLQLFVADQHKNLLGIGREFDHLLCFW